MRRLPRLRVILLGAALVCGGGCQRPIYDWGSFEGSILRLYKAENNLKIDQDILRLSEEITRTRQEKKKPPPGKLAHLGLLYSLNGDRESALRCFRAEKEAFPESAVFVDGVIARAQ